MIKLLEILHQIFNIRCITADFFIEDAEQLQLNFTSLEKRERSSQMVHYKYLLHGHSLESVSSEKYLGDTLNIKLNLTEHIYNIRVKSCKTLGLGMRADAKFTAHSTRSEAYVASPM